MLDCQMTQALFERLISEIAAERGREVRIMAVDHVQNIGGVWTALLAPDYLQITIDTSDENTIPLVKDAIRRQLEAAD